MQFHAQTIGWRPIMSLALAAMLLGHRLLSS